MKSANYPESIHCDVKSHLGVDIQHLIMLTQQKSFKMPSGLNREERRAWAKRNQKIQTAQR